MTAPQHARACEAARAIGGRLAAAGGALVALVSLLQHAPLTIACARGAATPHSAPPWTSCWPVTGTILSSKIQPSPALRRSCLSMSAPAK